MCVISFLTLTEALTGGYSSYAHFTDRKTEARMPYPASYNLILAEQGVEARSVFTTSQELLQVLPFKKY